MSGPGNTRKSERKHFRSWDGAGAEDVLPRLEMKPEIGITNRSRGEEKGVGKNVELKGFMQRLVHGWKEGGGQTGRLTSKSATLEVTAFKI